MQSGNQNGIIFTGTIYEWLIELLKKQLPPKKNSTQKKTQVVDRWGFTYHPD